jgi:hypothetical protein
MLIKKLHDAVCQHCIAALQHIRSERPNDRFYGYALYTSGGLDYAFLTAFSQEGLDQIVSKYQENPIFDTKSEFDLRSSLKWSSADSPLHGLCECLPGDLDGLMAEISENYYDSEDDVQAEELCREVEKIFIEALKKLDADGLFGTGEDRQKIVVNILKGDQSIEEKVHFASLLNSPEILSGFEEDMAQFEKQWARSEIATPRKPSD